MKIIKVKREGRVGGGRAAGGKRVRCIFSGIFFMDFLDFRYFVQQLIF